MEIAGSMRVRRALSMIVGTALAVILSLAVVPGRAWAYYSLDPVDIWLGQSSVSLVAGEQTSVGVGLSIASEQQTVGCGMAECPEACDSLTTPSGVLGGCSDANGWCTCAGGDYHTYYTDVTAYSDNPGVARASYDGGALNITGYSAGTANITVTASLRQHIENSTTLTVYVSEPSSGGGQWENPYSPSGSSGEVATVTPGGSGSGLTSYNGVSVSSAGVPIAAAQTASDQKNETEIVASNGALMLVVQANGAVNCSEELAKIAGTDGTCTFWSGSSSDRPDISWTFSGKNLDPNGNLDMELGVSVSEKGTGIVADVLENAKDSLVIEWQHDGDMPGEAQVYVRTGDQYADGTQLTLYSFNEQTNRFERVKDGIVVNGGYATFNIDHCSTWALSTDDLTRLGASSVTDDIAKQNTEGASNGTLWIVIIAVALVAAAVVAVAVMLSARKRRIQAIEPEQVSSADPTQVMGADDTGSDGNVTPRDGSHDGDAPSR